MTAAEARAEQRRDLRDALRVFAQPKTAMMLVLGFTAGLPFLLYFSTLSVWLKESRIDEAVIGFFSWFGLAYSFKFLWAPVVDRFSPPGLTSIFGRRRAWIFVAQIGLALAMLGIGFADPVRSLGATALFSFLIAFCSATQDIGVDAWRIEAAASDEEQATLAAAYQYGYKVGMVISGGVALVVAGGAGFPIAYWSMAAAMALAALVFAVWDRRYGLQSAAAAGVLLVAVGVASAFGAFAGVMESGSAGAIVFHLLQWAFYLVAAAAAIGFAAALAAALADRPDNTTFSFGRLALGLGFAIAAFAGVACAAAAMGWLLPRIGAAAGLAPSRGEIAQWALYLAAAPILACAVAIPFIRRLPGEAPQLNHPMLAPFLDFFWRHGWTALWILLFVSTYRLSDIVMGIMAKPAYTHMGYSPADIGIVSGAYGPWIIFVGVALAGLSALRLGLRTSLVLGAVVSVLGNLTFAWLVLQPPGSLVPLFIAVTADNIAGGYAGTIFVAFMSSMVSRSFAGTQYAIFSSIYTLGPKLVAGTSGVMVLAFSGGQAATIEGYSAFFLFAAALGGPAIALSFLANGFKPDREAKAAEPAPASV